MQDKKVISILGAGWLGLPLAEDLLNTDYQVKLATRSDERYQQLIHNKELSIHQLDIENSECDFSEFLQADILIVNIPNKNVEAFTRFVSLIDAASVSRVIFTSSTSVYKNVQREVSEDSGDENHEHPLFQIEELFRNGQSFKATLIRLAGLVGYSRHPGNWFKSRPVPQPDAPINLIHRDDCIGIIRAIIAKEAWGQTFNACSTTHPSKREYYSLMRKQISDVPLEFAEPEETLYKTVCNQKVINELDYDFVYPDMLKCENFRVVL